MKINVFFSLFDRRRHTSFQTGQELFGFVLFYILDMLAIFQTIFSSFSIFLCISSSFSFFSLVSALWLMPPRKKSFALMRR